MDWTRQRVFALIMIVMAALLGCSDDDDPAAPTDPEEPRLEAIVVSPDSVTFNGIGEELRFDAVAYDQGGAPIETEFTWQTSDPAVVVVDVKGNALTTGLGTARVYAISGSVADSSEVEVTLGGAPAREWVAGGSGNWEDGGNWSGGVVPGPAEVAVITETGTYTVTINGDVNVEGLMLGDPSGTQTLDVGNFNLRLSTGGLLPGAELLVQGEVLIQGDVVWAGGDIAGNGRVQVESSGEVHVTGDPMDVDARIDNNGTIVAHAGSSLRINRWLENTFSGLVEFQGDAILTVQFDGIFNSTGTVLKSQGADEASILVSSTDNSEFNSTGSILVDVGSLNISGGSLRGLMAIEEGATLRQSGNTVIPNLNSRGDGVFIVGGRVDFGTWDRQIIDLSNLVLDSASSPSISGLASLVINDSFVWRRGSVAGPGSLNSQITSRITFEDGGSKTLSGTRWNIDGDVAGDRNVDLTLREGAVMSLGNRGSWLQNGAGTITQNSTDSCRVDIIGTFQKVGEGAFSVDTALNCSGTLDLRGSALVVGGDFNLLPSGVITGGGTADLTRNLRLNLLNASSAVMGGTIRPDLDGEPARLDIQGLFDMDPTFSIELDVVTTGSFNTESVYFLTSGQPFGGTLALNVVQPPDPGVPYQVIYSFASNGVFIVTGDEPFIETNQSSTGVVCTR